MLGLYAHVSLEKDQPNLDTKDASNIVRNSIVTQKYSEMREVCQRVYEKRIVDFMRFMSLTRDPSDIFMQAVVWAAEDMTAESGQTLSTSFWNRGTRISRWIRDKQRGASKKNLDVKVGSETDTEADT